MSTRNSSESHAVYDFRRPDRILIGATDDAAADTVARLYSVSEEEALRMVESAEVVEVREQRVPHDQISYTNSLAQLCSRVGADIRDVTRCAAPTSASGGTSCNRSGWERVVPAETPRRWCTPEGATGQIYQSVIRARDQPR